MISVVWYLLYWYPVFLVWSWAIYRYTPTMQITSKSMSNLKEIAIFQKLLMFDFHANMARRPWWPWPEDTLPLYGGYPPGQSWAQMGRNDDGNGAGQWDQPMTQIGKANDANGTGQWRKFDRPMARMRQDNGIKEIGHWCRWGRWMMQVRLSNDSNE